MKETQNKKFNQSHIQIVSSLNYSKSLKFKFFDVTRYITASPESRTAPPMSHGRHASEPKCMSRSILNFFRMIIKFLSLKWTLDMKSYLELPVHENRCDLSWLKLKKISRDLSPLRTVILLDASRLLMLCNLHPLYQMSYRYSRKKLCQRFLLQKLILKSLLGI